jgi:Ca2+-binding EF-hand superfamily protein
MGFGPLFKGVDKDKNGLISRQEAEQSLPWVSRHFDELDVTKDGQVSIEEIRLWRKNRQNVFIERSP